MKGASHIAPLGVRLPDDLKQKIQERARRNGRSMNSEIVQILEDALHVDAGLSPPQKLDAEMVQVLKSYIAELVKDLANKKP